MKTCITKQTCLFFIFIFFFSGLTSCGGQSSDPGLEKAAQVIQYMMVPRNLSRSAFSVAFTDPKPSNFVSYIFSPMGLSYQLF